MPVQPQDVVTWLATSEHLRWKILAEKAGWHEPEEQHRSTDQGNFERDAVEIAIAANAAEVNSIDGMREILSMIPDENAVFIFENMRWALEQQGKDPHASAADYVTIILLAVNNAGPKLLKNAYGWRPHMALAFMCAWSMLRSAPAE